MSIWHSRDLQIKVPRMISTTFVQSLTSTSFPKFSKKLLPPAFNLTCLLTLCLLLFNLLTGSSIQLKLLFSKFTMTSSLRWIVVRSLHSFFLTYLLLSTLSIIPSFSLVFKIGLVLMVFLLLGSHPISHLALRQSQSMIPSLHSLLFPVVYPKVPYLAHYFLLSILLLFARWSQKIPSNIICILMTPSCTSLSLLQILLYLLTHLPPLSMTFSPGWIWTNYSLTLGLLGGGGGYHPPPPLAFFPYYFFDDSNWKNCFSVSVTRDRRHILAYVTSSWRCHVTYVMTSTVHDNRRKHRCFTIVRLSRYLSKYLWYGNEVGVVSNIFEVKEFKNVEIIYMTLTDDLEIQGQTSLKLTFHY